MEHVQATRHRRSRSALHFNKDADHLYELLVALHLRAVDLGRLGWPFVFLSVNDIPVAILGTWLLLPTHLWQRRTRASLSQLSPEHLTVTYLAAPAAAMCNVAAVDADVVLDAVVAVAREGMFWDSHNNVH